MAEYQVTLLKRCSGAILKLRVFAHRADEAVDAVCSGADHVEDVCRLPAVDEQPVVMYNGEMCRDLLEGAKVCG